jgi:hypothetical protein
MFSNRRSLIAIAMLLCGASAQGQTDAELEQQVRAAEAQLRDSAAQTREAERATAAEAQEIDALMRQAEAQLAEAAQQIAELSQKQMPRMSGLERRIFIDRSRPVLGVNVGTDEDDGPVEGAEIVAVSPGGAAAGAAAEAGLRAGDIITAVNGESMSAGSGAEASRLLVDFMQGVVDGDVLEIDYLRDGNVRNLEVAPRSMTATLFSAGGPNFDVHVAPGTLATPTEPHARSFWIAGGSWGDMEMVALTERLGSYFGTDEGLLVVRAPRDEALKRRSSSRTAMSSTALAGGCRIRCPTPCAYSHPTRLARSSRSRSCATGRSAPSTSKCRTTEPAVCEILRCRPCAGG